ncbi:TonB-dependent receptor [Dyadobacter fanqingshengii]|uniref:TonB-dependent receptor n=1 Tax=Dyadobacter fanqingshengii TaxID=2906443 RepID=A0A9X1PAJ2_9BACT|nr:TonB-dependent receptor [Dyadobacter fanqingshengii]MCF0040982.1 TonB-dependent receptor [Dyadobacter fanqingshengii]MCF2505914.1 TonB-dependent receptor [Dyadobacter fanqingshengii]USJ37287.1 TonB-dependent receptor [Dyadobacter fanqingshengii]
MTKSTAIRSSLFLLTLGFSSQFAFAQRGEIESQTYEIVKEKSIEFAPANRVYDKVDPIKGETGKKKVDYQIIDPQIDLSSPKLTPSVAASSDEQKRKDEPDVLNNYVKLGAGNYGRFLGEAFVGGRPSEDLVFTTQLKHLSAANGPVDDKNSANAATNFRVGGKYIRSKYKVEAALDYDRKNYYFYGYQPQPETVQVNRDSIRQTINRFGVALGFENTDASVLVDYSVKTSLHTLRDRYEASELDWGTKLMASVPLSESFHALLEADAFVTQRVDRFTFNRNLFRVKPTFKYTSELFSVTAGINVANETDSELEINRTKAFPVLNIDVAPFAGLHIFAGWNGDMVRNTLKSMLGENQWLGPNVQILNTDKDYEISGGVKGEGLAGFNYEGKVAYTQYRNFYYFNNSLADTSKFAILYDPGKTKVLSISGQAGYNFNDLFKTSLKVNFFDYSVSDLEEPWHRPDLTLNWFNALSISKKLFVTADFYMLRGIKAKNFQTGEVTKLPVIADLNFKIDYLLTRNFSAFVALNNVLGKQYQRYQYYPQQGLNFIGGLSFSF